MLAIATPRGLHLSAQHAIAQTALEEMPKQQTEKLAISVLGAGPPHSLQSVWGPALCPCIVNK